MFDTRNIDATSQSKSFKSTNEKTMEYAIVTGIPCFDRVTRGHQGRKRVIKRGTDWNDARNEGAYRSAVCSRTQTVLCDTKRCPQYR